MRDPGEEISSAMRAIEFERLDEMWRARYRAATKILRQIPSGTRDEDLTPEQRRAWSDHDAALRWIQSSWATTFAEGAHHD